MKLRTLSVTLAGLLATGLYTAVASAADLKVTMHKVNATGVGESIGTVSFRDSGELGLLIIPNLSGLSPGAHGFHVHENPDCGPAVKDGKQVPGGAAGGHYDPEGTGRHEGPVGTGHLGDLPVLLVGPDGTATMAMFAPRLQVPDLVGRSLMVHAGGDNYSDEPAKLGGGGARVACGVLEVDALDND
ncbi:MAG: superoxide dismutase [Cu-Zn] SodC [Gammaproteobacteria bacterium]|jgi:Cu-Zn family superoxide dismutase